MTIATTDSSATGQHFGFSAKPAWVSSKCPPTHADVDLKDVYIPFRSRRRDFVSQASLYPRHVSTHMVGTLLTLSSIRRGCLCRFRLPPLRSVRGNAWPGPRFITATLTGSRYFAALLFTTTWHLLRDPPTRSAADADRNSTGDRPTSVAVTSNGSRDSGRCLRLLCRWCLRRKRRVRALITEPTLRLGPLQTLGQSQSLYFSGHCKDCLPLWFRRCASLALIR